MRWTERAPCLMIVCIACLAMIHALDAACPLLEDCLQCLLLDALSLSDAVPEWMSSRPPNRGRGFRPNLLFQGGPRARDRRLCVLAVHGEFGPVLWLPGSPSLTSRPRNLAASIQAAAIRGFEQIFGGCLHCPTPPVLAPLTARIARDNAP